MGKSWCLRRSGRNSIVRAAIPVQHERHTDGPRLVASLGPSSLPAYLKVSLISPTHQLRSVITHRHCVSFATPVLAHTCLNVFKINFYL